MNMIDLKVSVKAQFVLSAYQSIAASPPHALSPMGEDQVREALLRKISE